MKKLIFAFVGLFIGLHIHAQQIVSGRVTADELPINGAIVMEVDEENRIMNQATTDANGHYTMKVTRGNNSMEIIADGYRKFSQPMRGRKSINTALIPRTSIAGAELLDKMHPEANSYKLLYGILAGRAVPQYIRVELLDDSTFVIVPPVHSIGNNEIYPAENVMIFVDGEDRHLMSGVAPRDAYTMYGRPEDVDSKTVLSQKRWMGDEESRSNLQGDVNTYPQFVFSMKRLKHMLESPNRPARVLIETAAKDNFWILYPADNYEKELQRILTKLQKKLKKK